MDAALGWLGDVARFFGSWVPHSFKVLKTHEGVKFVRGKHTVVLKPGFYWYVPALTDVYMLPVVEQPLPISVQCGSTADYKAVAIGGIVTYRITDIHAALVDAYDIETIIEDRSLAVFNQFVSERTFSQVLTGSDEKHEEGPRGGRVRVNAELGRLVAVELKSYGIEVIRAQLTHFGLSTTLVHVGQGPPVAMPPESPTEEE